MTTTTNYAILRLVPDQARGEIVNVGAVFFLDGYLDVRVLPSASKIRAVNPNAPVDALYHLPDVLNGLCKNIPDDAARYRIIKNFPLIEVSDMGFFVSEDSAYEQRVQSIIDRFVKVPARKWVADKATRLEKELKLAFSASKILGLNPGDINRHVVVPNFPISASEELYADFALKNGSWHITAAVDFRVARTSIRGAKRGQAALKAVTLDSAVRRFGNANCIPLTVFTVNDEDRSLVEPQIAMLADYSERVFDFSVPDDRAAYMEHMAKAAHSMN